MIVLDASAVVEIVLGTAVGRSLAVRIAPETLGLHSPHLLDVEVAQVVRRYLLAGQVTQDRARRAIEHLLALGVSKELLPERLVVVGELPRSSGGKVAKGQLREDIRSRMEAADECS